MRRTLAASLLVVACCTALAQQSGPEVSAPAELSAVTYYALRVQAREAIAKQRWEEALPMFERLAAYSGDDGEVWQAIGDCHYNLKQPAKAIEPYKKALALGHGAIENHAYNIGCCYALAGDKEQAFRWVEKALAMRFEDRSAIQRDEDLISLRDDKRFAKLAGILPRIMERVEGWRYDLDYLLGEMRRMHYVYSERPLPKAILDEAAKVRRDIPQMDDVEILAAFQRMVVHLEDGHSTLQPISDRIRPLRMPLKLYAFQDGLYVIASNDDHKGLVGARVKAIGGKPSEALMRDVAAYVSRDNDEGIRWSGPNYLCYFSVLKTLGAAKQPDRATLTIVEPSGREADIDIAAGNINLPILQRLAPSPLANAGPAPLYLRRTKERYWMEPMPDAKAMYVQYNSVVNDTGESLAQFGLRLRQELKKPEFENVIVDVRHNGGGNSYLNKELVRTLVTFEAAKSGRIFLITGRATFSAAQNFTNDVVRMTSAIVVGEPTSSKPFFVGESARIQLPYSGIRGTISTRLHTVDARDRRVWIPPAVPVSFTAKDYFANRDAALEAVLGVIAGG